MKKQFINTIKYCELCVERIRNELIVLGGDNIVVEFDEPHLFRRKYGKGAGLAFEDIWIFGMIERESKKFFLQQVEKSDSETLFEIVSLHLLPGSLCKSGMCRG
jgi:hypothetical protein